MSEGYGTDDRLIGQFDGQDPYLQYQPAFAYTLPIQLFVNGITITLLLVLFMHLAFTTQYHYPLAPLNYSLQLLSIVTVIISVTVKIWVILVDSSDSADTWPYSLDYVAVSIPPRAWNTAQDAAWFVLQTFNNVLTHITHIQFLTLLYPSRTEARLIIFVLGPLAVISSGLCLSALSGSQTVLDVTDSIRNVLNSTLLLIYSMALVIWGFFVNRRRAWRTDGGTAAFGFGAMVLAAISTSGNFVAVAEDGIDWLQHLLFAAILWQTWLGWWWWVGSGMGIGEVEDLMERAERKKRKAARRAARQRATERGERIPLRHRSSSLAGIVDAGQASANAMAGFTTSVTGILRNRSATLVRRSTTRSVPSDSRVRDVEEGLDGRANSSPAIEMENLGGRRSGDRASRAGTNGTNGTGRVEFTNTPTPPDSRTGAVMQSTNSETSSTSATPSLHTPRTFGQLMSFPINGLQVYLRRLRRAHEEAARQAALQRVERRQAVFESSRRESATGGGAHAEGPPVTNSAALAEAALIDGEGVGWGLGSFGIKEHRESAMRLQAARERLQEGQLLNTTREENEQLVQSSREAAVDAENTGEGTSAGPSTPLRSNQTAGGQGRPELAPVVDSDTPGPSAGPSREPGRSRARQNQVRESDGEWEDLDETTSSSSGGRFTWRKKDRKRANKGKRRSDDAGGDAPAGRTGAAGETGRAEPTMQGGWSWWGPLKEWRLNDRSAF